MTPWLQSGTRTGFTLIELLLVLAIIGIVTVIVAPNLANSIQGNRLRSATRAIVQAGRYARASALLRQQEVVLEIDINGSAVSVHQEVPVVADEPGPDDDLQDDVDEAGEPNSPVFAEMAIEPDYSQSTQTEQKMEGREILSRELDSVTVQVVEIDDQDVVLKEGRARIVYRSNGMCSPYMVEIEDRKGARVRIEVDALASAQTERLQ